jgi:hypothetical protein
MTVTRKSRPPPEPRPGFLNRDKTEFRRYGAFAEVEKRQHVPRCKWGRRLLGLPPQRQPKPE